MTAISTNTPVNANVSTAGRGLFRRLLDNYAYMQTMRTLSLMSDRELSDVGIERGDIRAIAHQCVYGA